MGCAASAASGPALTLPGAPVKHLKLTAAEQLMNVSEPLSSDAHGTCAAASEPGESSPPSEHISADTRAEGATAPAQLQAKPHVASSCSMDTAVLALLRQPQPEVDVTERGVSLAYIMRMAESGVLDESWTVQQVVDLYVRPQTSAHKCCLFDVVPTSSTGKPRYFISHTWSRKLVALVALLKAHFKVTSPNDAAAQVFLWLDIMAINQHPYEEKGCLLNDDVANLAKVVRCTEQTLFCLDEECVALSRIWCLYEVWQTFLVGGAAQLLLLMPLVPPEQLRRVFNTFDVMRAEATQLADKLRIQAEISESIGPAAMNLTLKRALVDSARLEADTTDATDVHLPVVLLKAARLLRLNGEFQEALPYFLQALQACEAVLGVRSINGVPVAPAKCPQIESAADSLAQQQVTAERLMGASHTTFIGEVALCLEAIGRYAEALPMFQDALIICEQAQGATHRDSLTFTSQCATCLDKMGRSEEALKLFLRAQEAGLLTLGPDHVDTLVFTSQLATCLDHLGRGDEALPMFEHLLTSGARVLGESHPETIKCGSRLASCLKKMGRFEDALPVLRRALAGSEAVLGTDHPDTLTVRGNLASCLSRMGQFDEALPLAHTTMEASVRVLGALHPFTLAFLTNLANCLDGMGRADDALPVFQKALEASTAVLGTTHPNTLTLLGNLAASLYSKGRYDEALPLICQSMEASEKVLGAMHPDTLSDITNCATCLDKMGRQGEALPLFRRAWAVNQQIHGLHSAGTLTANSMLATCLDTLGHHAEALPLFRETLEGRINLLGAQHPAVMVSARKLAMCLCSMGSYEEALPMLQQAARACEQALGADHLDTLAALVRLASCIEKMEQKISQST